MYSENKRECTLNRSTIHIIQKYAHCTLHFSIERFPIEQNRTAEVGWFLSIHWMEWYSYGGSGGGNNNKMTCYLEGVFFFFLVLNGAALCASYKNSKCLLIYVIVWSNFSSKWLKMTNGKLANTHHCIWIGFGNIRSRQTLFHTLFSNKKTIKTNVVCSFKRST